MSDKPWDDLESYLKRHEDDIAVDENDFGDLQSVFRLILGREPKFRGIRIENKTVET